MNDYVLLSNKERTIIQNIVININDILKLKNEEHRIERLTKQIIEIINQDKSIIEKIKISEMKFGDIILPHEENIFSILLFLRGLSSCRLVMFSNQMKHINNAFIDFNFALFFSKSLEMLGLICLFRAYYLPKNENECQKNNEYLQNEISIVANCLNTNTDIYKKLVGDFVLHRIEPQIKYYFLSDVLDEDIRYKYTFSLCSFTDYQIGSLINPISCINSMDISYGFINDLVKLEDYALLSKM